MEAFNLYARWFVLLSDLNWWSTMPVAMNIGLSEAVIGVTIVALGTSLPELVVGIVSVSRKEHELMVGSIINILFVLGIAAVIYPIDIPAGIWVNLVSLFLSMLVFCGSGSSQQLYLA